MNALPRQLITNMVHDHIVAAAAMLRIGDLHLTRYELASALEALSQLDTLVPSPSANPIPSILPLPPIACPQN